MEFQREQLSYGQGGWVRYRSSLSDAVTYVRYADRAGRLVAVEMYVEMLNDSAIDTSTLRQVPLGGIDASVNAEQSMVRDRLPLAGPDLRRAARHFSKHWGDSTKVPHWVAAMWWAQVKGSGVPQAPMPKLEPLEPVDLPPVDASLRVPRARPYGDDFYADVAAVYRELAQVSRSPAGDIADANRVPVTTAHRWVKVARQRGFLEPGHKGKRG
ncbi:MAG: hypothetical protein ACR2H3_04375 [Acidimicrobiales bacterium]